MNKRILMLLVACLLPLGMISCSKEQGGGHTVKVGTVAGPEAELMETAKQVAKQRYGLNVRITTFSDYNTPNIALNDNSIDANVFQHEPFLLQQSQQRHYKFAVVGKTFIYPMGIYSKKIHSLSDLSDGAHVAIPNDPTNEARALLLLQQAKLIELDPKAGINATPADVSSNPYQLVLTELNAAQLPRTLDDVDVAVINTNYAVTAGLSPVHDALFHEGEDSPYANIVVVRAQDQQDIRFHQLVEALHSTEVQAKAKQLFGESVIPAFK